MKEKLFVPKFYRLIVILLMIITPPGHLATSGQKNGTIWPQ
jgi:hypothetical protein